MSNRVILVNLELYGMTSLDLVCIMKLEEILRHKDIKCIQIFDCINGRNQNHGHLKQ